jgi:tetratricopeptide (TPR) repeat protein
MLLAGSGNNADAQVHLRAAVEANTNSVMALSNLAWLLAAASDPTMRNGQEAVSLAERACRLTSYQNAQIIGTLADAYAEAGRFDDAVATAQKAHDVALASGQQDLAARNAQLLELYKSHMAFHMGANP